MCDSVKASPQTEELASSLLKAPLLGLQSDMVVPTMLTFVIMIAIAL